MSGSDTGMRRFMVSGPCAPGDIVTLGPDRSRHLVRVLRARSGQAVRLFTGDGLEYVGTVEVADPRAARLRVVRLCRENPPVDSELLVAFAPPPGQRADVLLEKATEAGATRFQPLLTERVQAHQERSAQRRTERWERKVQDAARQAGRLLVPQVREPAPFSDFVSEFGGECLVGADSTAEPLWNVLAGWQRAPQRVTMCVGPAGGLTSEELVTAREAGCRLVSLGPHVLRVETAAVCMLSAVVMRLHAMSLENEE